MCIPARWPAGAGTKVANSIDMKMSCSINLLLLLQVLAYTEAATCAAHTKYSEVNSSYQCSGIGDHIRRVRHVKRRGTVFQHQKFIVQKSSVR